MSDAPKDFRYYADKAEALLLGTSELANDDDNGARMLIGIATVYAELAKAAPRFEHQTQYRAVVIGGGGPGDSTVKATQLQPCNVSLHGISNGGYDGTSQPCALVYGHTGMHETDEGVPFRGFGTVNFPGQGGK